MAITGCIPAYASPAALVTACCSAMPTSIVLSGKFCANLSKPVGPSIAAVIATTLELSRPMCVISSEKTLVHDGAEAFSGFPVTGSTIPTA